MNSYNEARIGMTLKVKQFLADRAAELLGITAIAGVQTALNTAIADALDADARATADTRGYTATKQEALELMAKKALKVSRGAAVYYEVNNDESKREEVAFEKSEILYAKRDTDAYVKARQVFQLAQPIQALMGAYNVLPADVDELNIRAEQFLSVVQLPERKVGEKKSWNEEFVRILDGINNDILLKQLDPLMGTIEFDNEQLFSEYQSARSIDNNPTGGGGTEVLASYEDILAALAIINLGLLASGATQLRITVVEGGPLEFGLSMDGTTFNGNTTTIAGPGTETIFIVNIASSGNLILVRNQNISLQGKYKVEVLG
jgi:hypothetical protein